MAKTKPQTVALKAPVEPQVPSDAEIEMDDNLAMAAEIDKIPGSTTNEMDAGFRPGTVIEVDDDEGKGEREPTPAGRQEEPVGEPAGKKPPEARVKDEDKRPEFIKKLEKDLDEIQPRAGNERDTRGYAALKGKITEVGAEVVKRDEQLLGLTKEIEELKKRVIPEEQLQQWRAMEHHLATREVESLPKWKEYDRAVEQINDSALEFLTGAAKTAGIHDRVLEIVKERGGVVAFSSSDKLAGKNWKNPDGTPMTEAQWFNSQVFSKLNDMQRAEFSSMTADARRKQREKQTAIEAAKGDAENVLRQERDKGMATFNDRANAALKKWMEVELKDLGLDPNGPPTIPDDATPEQKAKLQRQIDAWKKADEEIPKLTVAMTPEERVTIAAKASLTDYLKVENKELSKELDDWKKRAETAEGKLEGIRSSRQTSRLGARTPAPGSNDKKKDSELTDEQAVEQRFGR